MYVRGGSAVYDKCQKLKKCPVMPQLSLFSRPPLTPCPWPDTVLTGDGWMEQRDGWKEGRERDKQRADLLFPMLCQLCHQLIKTADTLLTPLSYHSVHTHCPHTLSTHTVHTHCPHTMSTHTVHTHCPHTLSTHPWHPLQLHLSHN